MPTWVRVLALFGFPTLLAAFLVWRLVVGVEGAVNATQAELRAHKIEVQQHIDHTVRAVAQIDELLRVQTSVARQICVNTAQTREQQRLCIH